MPNCHGNKPNVIYKNHLISKKVPIVDLISGSAINPIFRFYSGWVLLTQAFNAPLLPLVFIVGLQFMDSAYTGCPQKI